MTNENIHTKNAMKEQSSKDMDVYVTRGSERHNMRDMILILTMYFHQDLVLLAPAG